MIAATPRSTLLAAAKPRTIDLSQLDDIRDSLGPDKLLRLLQLAQSELAERPGVIRRISEREGFAELRREAHSFRGAVASFGLAGVALAAKAVKLAAPGTELELALDRLEREATRAHVALARLLSAQPVEVAVNG